MSTNNIDFQKEFGFSEDDISAAKRAVIMANPELSFKPLNQEYFKNIKTMHDAIMEDVKPEVNKTILVLAIQLADEVIRDNEHAHIKYDGYDYKVYYPEASETTDNGLHISIGKYTILKGYLDNRQYNDFERYVESTGNCKLTDTGGLKPVTTYPEVAVA